MILLVMLTCVVSIPRGAENLHVGILNSMRTIAVVHRSLLTCVHSRVHGSRGVRTTVVPLAALASLPASNPTAVRTWPSLSLGHSTGP